MEAQQSASSSHEGPAYWNDSFVEYADTLGGLEFTTAEASLLAEVIRSARRASTRSSDRDTPADSSRDRRSGELEWHTLITQPARSEPHRISKQQRRAFDRTKWNRSKEKNNSVNAEDTLCEAWMRHQERQSVWSDSAALSQTHKASTTPIEDGCLAPALLHRDSLDGSEGPHIPKFSITDLEGDLWPQTFV